jgi:hypothetical protein
MYSLHDNCNHNAKYTGYVRLICCHSHVCFRPATAKTAMGPPPARMEPQTFGVYAPGTSLPSRSMPAAPAAPYSQGYAQHAWSTGAPAYGGHSVCRTEMTGRAAPPLGRSWWAAAPSLISLVHPRCTTLQVHSLRMTRSRLHLLRLILIVLQMYLRIRRTTYADVLGLGGGPREREIRDMRGRYS